MKGVTWVAAIVAGVIGAAALAIGVTAASSSASLPVAYGFDGNSGWHHGLVKPRAIYFGAGGNLLVRDLNWASWTDDAAAGRGVRWADNCVPTCAAGTYAKVPAEMTLSRVRARNGVTYFSLMTLRWTIAGKQYKSIYDWSYSPVRGTPPFWS